MQFRGDVTAGDAVGPHAHQQPLQVPADPVVHVAGEALAFLENSGVADLDVEGLLLTGDDPVLAQSVAAGLAQALHHHLAIAPNRDRGTDQQQRTRRIVGQLKNHVRRWHRPQPRSQDERRQPAQQRRHCQSEQQPSGPVAGVPAAPDDHSARGDRGADFE